VLLAVCLGVAVHGATPATRIVSTSPSVTESLFAMGLGDRVVGVSTFCRFPAEAARLPKIGTFLRPDTELIARLKPDLVVVFAGPHDVPRQLSALGIRSITVERGTLPSVYSTIRAIGDAAGVPDRAEALIDRLRRRLGQVHAAVSGRPPRKILIIVGRRPGSLTDLIAAGRGSYLNDLVALAGGVNVLGGDGVADYPRVSMETVIRLAPDVIVDAGDMGDTVDEHMRRKTATEALWARERSVAAAEAGRVHAVTSDAFVVPGPRVVDVVEALADWLHGVRVP